MTWKYCVVLYYIQARAHFKTILLIKYDKFY